MSSDSLADWCLRWLGAVPAAELFDAGLLSTVKGLRLSDGREVVVKVRPDVPRLAGCAAVHRRLWAAGFPCPEPLVDLQPFDDQVANAELLTSVDHDVPSADVAVRSAAALAHLVELAPDPASVPSLAPSPSWTGWDHGGTGLWPVSEEFDADLNDYRAPRWLDRVATALHANLCDFAGAPVIGHGDWHPENLCWRGPSLIAVHDWDSVICQPEPFVVGFAAVSFRGLDTTATMATIDDSAAFVAAYQHARGSRWTRRDEAASWAAGLWQRAVDAKVQSLEGDVEQFLPRDEAAARLRRAGLDSRLVSDADAT